MTYRRLGLLLIAAAAGACTENAPPPRTIAATPPTVAAARDLVRIEDAYLWELVQKLRGFRFHADLAQKERVTVAQIVIARDGQLLNAEIVRSSGEADVDHNILAALRQGSPYAPLPPQIPGSSARFRLPLISMPN